MFDFLLAVSLGACGDGTAADDDQIGDRPLGGEGDDGVSGGEEVGLEVEGFGAVEAASECLEGDSHDGGLGRETGKEVEEKEIREVEGTMERDRGENRPRAGVEPGE